MRPLDALDAQILLALDDDPSQSVLALSRRIGVARNTVHARLNRLECSGALAAHSRRLTAGALGCELTAFVNVFLSQTTTEATFEDLSAIAHVVEVHSTTGDADLIVKVVARDTADLRRVTDRILAARGVQRTSTAVSLEEVVPFRLTNLLQELAAPPDADRR